MTLMIIGLLLWASLHFIPSLAQPLKARWVDRLGSNGYQGSFAVLVLLSLVFIVLGWRSIEPEVLYVLPNFTRHIAMLIMLLVVILLGASHAPSRIKRFVRHPMLTAVALWSCAHLLANGDHRSLVLFGGMGLWALLNIVAINRRDGEWLKAEAPNMAVELRGLGISVVIYLALMFAHPWFTGMSLHG